MCVRNAPYCVWLCYLDASSRGFKRPQAAVGTFITLVPIWWGGGGAGRCAQMKEDYPAERDQQCTRRGRWCCCCCKHSHLGTQRAPREQTVGDRNGPALASSIIYLHSHLWPRWLEPIWLSWCWHLSGIDASEMCACCLLCRHKKIIRAIGKCLFCQFTVNILAEELGHCGLSAHPSS